MYKPKKKQLLSVVHVTIYVLMQRTIHT